MKYLFLILLLFISQINTVQRWVRTGTGLRDVSFQWKLPGMKTGCLFMAVCAIGGLGTDKEMLDARKWANDKGYARGTTCLIDIKELARRISQQFKTEYHSSWNVKKGCNHYWTIDGRGKEVFNAAGLGYTHCKK